MSNDEPSATPAAAAKRRGSGVDLDAWKGVWVGIELERGRVHPVSWELLGEGRKLADHLGVPFVELDDEIEREAGVPGSEIFSLYGQNAYRRFEKRCLERIIEHHEHVVIAAGGGLVTEAPTYELLRSACYTVWIRASPEEHMQRVIAQGDLRPMTGREEAMADLRRILAERNDLYGLADAVIDTSNKTVDASQEELQNMYNIST